MKETKEKYQHGVDMPKKAPAGGRPMGTFGCSDFKSDSMDQAYGQAGIEGCRMDQNKIHAQHFKTYTDENTAMKG